MEGMGRRARVRRGASDREEDSAMDGAREKREAEERLGLGNAPGPP